MKPEKKPFIVEIKNRRSLSRKERPIWGKIDLKTAIDQVASEHAGQDDDGTMRPMSSGSVAEQKPTDIIG